MNVTEDRMEKLYDLGDQDYPRGDGAVFRSLQVAECPVCMALTNRVVVVRWAHGSSIRTICPNAMECWHHDLEERAVLLSGYWVTREKRGMIEAEIVALREEHKPLIKNDIVGEPHMTRKTMVFRVRAQRPNQSCSHFL